MDMLKEKFIPAITKYYNKYNEGRSESERINPIIVQDNCPVHGLRAIRYGIYSLDLAFVSFEIGLRKALISTS